MTSRERVLAAFDHRQPDRVPLDLGGTHDSTLTLQNHEEVARLLGNTWDEYNLYDWTCGLVLPDERMLKAFRIDTRSIHSGKGRFHSLDEYYADIGVETLEDGSRILRDAAGVPTQKMPSGGGMFQPVQFPLRCDEDEDIARKVEEYLRDFSIDRDTIESYEEAARKAKILHEETEYAIVQSHFILMATCPMQNLMSWENWYIHLGLNPDRLKYATEIYVNKVVLPQAREYFSRVGPHVDVAYCIGDDLADARGPCFPLETYRSHFKPLHRLMVEEVRKHTKAKVLFHMCGSAHDFIGDLIDIGVDGINPVQTKSSDMQPERLKREFGRDMTFWGGLDTQYILSRGSRAQVVDETKRVLEVFSKDGGFVFAPCHNIQSGVPAENILAMYETAMEFNG